MTNIEPSASKVSTDGVKPGRFTNLLASLIIGLSSIMVLWNLQNTSLKNANTASRYATIESLVDHGTYYIDKSRYLFTIDKYKRGDHYLSSKPPTLPTYAAGVYWVYQKLTGQKITTHEHNVVWTVSLFTGGLAHLVFLIYFFRFTKILLRRRLAILVSLAAASFGYLGTAYATTINNHSIAAAVGFVGFYYAFRIRNRVQAHLRHWFVCGLCMGLLPAIDLTSLALSFAVGVYLLSYDWRKALSIYLPCLLPGIASQLAITYGVTGSLEPAYANPELKNFSGNYFRAVKTGIDALREPKHIYAFNAFLGHHGVFSMTPVFVFSLIEIVRNWRDRSRHFAELAVITFTSVVICTFYVWRTRNYGGWCVGMRWFIPLMPLLLLYFGLWLDRTKLTARVWSVVLAAFLVSAFNVQDGLTGPFQYSTWHNLLDGAPNRNRVPNKSYAQRKTKPTRNKAAMTD